MGRLGLSRERLTLRSFSGSESSRGVGVMCVGDCGGDGKCSKTE